MRKSKLYQKIKTLLLDEFGTLEEAADAIRNARGIVNCGVIGLCTWWDFENIFKIHKRQIFKYYRELFADTGMTFAEYFGKDWQDGDIFAPAKGNEAILAIGAVASICDEIFDDDEAEKGKRNAG